VNLATFLKSYVTTSSFNEHTFISWLMRPLIVIIMMSI